MTVLDFPATPGHEMKECTGAPREQTDVEKVPLMEQEFIFIRITVLREYLEKELQMTNLPFKQCIEVDICTLGILQLARILMAMFWE